MFLPHIMILENRRRRKASRTPRRWVDAFLIDTRNRKGRFRGDTVIPSLPEARGVPASAVSLKRSTTTSPSMARANALVSLWVHRTSSREDSSQRVGGTADLLDVLHLAPRDLTLCNTIWHEVASLLYIRSSRANKF